MCVGGRADGDDLCETEALGREEGDALVAEGEAEREAEPEADGLAEPEGAAPVSAETDAPPPENGTPPLVTEAVGPPVPAPPPAPPDS
ncbi:hypothetical protein SAMN05216259_1051, partial [Actinacidiphila guanduensis]